MHHMWSFSFFSAQKLNKRFCLFHVLLYQENGIIETDGPDVVHLDCHSEFEWIPCILRIKYIPSSHECFKSDGKLLGFQVQENDRTA